tara:strand:+ start:91 stop:330 length:240 start_codon:yes stop_codon:yes gene_type:complete
MQDRIRTRSAGETLQSDDEQSEIPKNAKLVSSSKANASFATGPTDRVSSARKPFIQANGSSPNSNLCDRLKQISLFKIN